MRCLTSAAWLASGRFKSFCAETVPPSPRIARHRANGLSVRVFMIVAVTLLRFSSLRYQIIANFSLGFRVELASATGNHYLGVDLGLKCRIIVAKLRLI